MSTLQCTPPLFPMTRTCRNLHSACLGELRARRQYLQSARQMEEAGLYVIAHAFRFTAAQEKEHADVLLGLLTALGGATPTAEDAPVLLPREPLALLEAASQSEAAEADALYPAHARIAQEEGYPRVATALRRMAETEQTHARRFRQYAAALADGTLFRDAERVGWLCLPCGQMHYGHDAPDACSTCGRSGGQFIRSSFYPFTVGR